ncbi:MAG: hypothetical protein ACLR7D_11315 [Lachnospira eligens]
MSLNSEMKWLRQINDYTPLLVANPIKGLDGKNIQEITGPDGNVYFCVICDFLLGEAPDENNEEQMVKQFRYLGETTAFIFTVRQRYGTEQTSLTVWYGLTTR